MNGNTIASAARGIALIAVLVTAAVLGLVLGNALQGRETSSAAANIGGMVAQNAGGTLAVAGPNFVDYALRHMATEKAYLDYGQRHATKAAGTVPQSGQRKGASPAADAPAQSLTTPTPR